MKRRFLLLAAALLAGCERSVPPPSKTDELVKQMSEQISALQDQMQRQSRQLEDLREMLKGDPQQAVQPSGPSREKLQAICDKTFGQGIANVLGIAESPDGSAAAGEIRIANLAVQGGVASGKAEARIAHYNDGRWLLKSIRLLSTEGNRYAWDFEVEL